MKQYYEFGVTKEDGKITGFFVKEGDKSPFFVSYVEFVEMVKQNQIQDLYWDDSAGIKVEMRDDSNTPKKVRGRVEKAMAKVPVITDFNTFVRRDAIFRYSGEKNVIPAAVLLVSRMFFVDVVTIAMPYTKEVEQLYHSIEENIPEYKDLFVCNAGGLSLNTTLASMEDVFGRIGELGYHVVLCMETARNAKEDGYLYKAISRFTKPSPERVLNRVETMITQLNYKAAMGAFNQSRKERGCGLYGNS